MASDDLADYDVISDGTRSLESSIADLGLAERREIYEPPPSQTAKEKFITPALTATDIQAYVQKALEASGHPIGQSRVVRVYVDGIFDGLNVSHVNQLRQAKLSFPSVHLIVGVYADELCDQYGYITTTPHDERSELLRHCRWVDQVVQDAPWRLDEAFLNAHRIDYVAIDEGTCIDPACDKERLKGYDLVKDLRKAIPTRRTVGLTTRPPPIQKKTWRQTSSESRHNTLRGVPRPPSTLKTVEASAEVEPEKPDNESEQETVAARGQAIEEKEQDPFEEPKVDEFGTGNGI
ncbi:hypothetical protein K474DRAFT_1666816 [Panus rudis PR-1116 ss-1]|nr:hypothetical protein K474DRAFT_1666816 [Panus rudis PR-1116 ss-1]